jgi:hypothetical protein
MSERKPTGDPRQQTDWKNQADGRAMEGAAGAKAERTGLPLDLEKWHETNTH